MFGKALLAGYLHRARFARRGVNVNRKERWLSTLLGLAVSSYAVRRKSGLIGRLAAAALGSAIAKRGVSGKCPVYRKLHLRST